MANLLKRFKRKEVLIILLCAVLIFGQVWLDLKLPDYMVEITKLVQTQGSKLVDILIQGGWMLLCAFGSLALGVITGYASAYVSSTFTLRIRKLLFDKVESFSMEEIKKFSTGLFLSSTMVPERVPNCCPYNGNTAKQHAITIICTKRFKV